VNRRIDISHKTIFFIAAFLAIIWALSQIIEVIVLLFVAIILMSGLAPIVGFIERRTRAPRALAIALSYIVIIGVLAGLISVIVIPLVEQTTNLAQVLPAKIEAIVPANFIDQSVIRQELTNFSRGALSFSLTIFSNFIALISVLVLTFYMLLERGGLDRLLGQFFPGYEAKISRVTGRIEDKLGSWLRGQVALSVIITVVVYAALLALGVPYALPLAILAGLLEIVPVIGPIISAIPAVIVAYFYSPVLAGIVVGVFFVIQQLENHFIVPQVMKKAVGLNPLTVILAVAVGGKLLGISGALLAVPIVVVLQTVIEELLKEDKNPGESLIP